MRSIIWPWKPPRTRALRPDAITDIALVGNSVMHHILLNIPPGELGQSPFGPAISDAVDIKARDLGLKLAPGAQAHVLPLEAGHVGADNVGVILAEEPDKAPADEIWLIVDVGTNGEILLGNSTELYSASSPTGPAFEGAQIRHGMRAAHGAIERMRIDPETLECRIKVIGRDAWNDDGARRTTRLTRPTAPSRGRAKTSGTRSAPAPAKQAPAAARTRPDPCRRHLRLRHHRGRRRAVHGRHAHARRTLRQ